ncbi:hypothetical protein MJL33_28005, partial [Salmonella enterica subsp. enterica serovar Kentucky]|nr:hypothetical protein [Salmonella enterica subsp. enterica serovar Kentucky]
GSGFGFRFQRRHGMAAFIDSGDQIAFSHIEAGADLRAVRQFMGKKIDVREIYGRRCALSPAGR